MREDLKKYILVDKRTQIDDEAGQDEAVFKSYANSSVFANRILESLLTKFVEEDGVKIFFADDKEKKFGYLSDIYGCVGVLSLVNRMGAVLSEEQKNDLVANIHYIIDCISENGYTMYPYLTETENKLEDGSKLFGPKNYPYTGAMTWAISFFTAVRKAVNEGLIVLEDEYLDKVYSLIRNIIETFNASVITDKEGHALGWGFTKGCETPSLFFTYSVLEAYSDFEDNLYDVRIEEENGENKVVREAIDPEFMALLNKRVKKDNGEEEIQDTWQRLCYEVADKVWSVYKKVLKEDFVNDVFLENHKVIKREDILKAGRSNALFNNIYLVYILLYGYVNKRSKDAEDVITTMEVALQNVQRTYEQLRRDGNEYLVDTYIIPFMSKHVDRGDVYSRTLYYMVDAKLMPMLVKANNVIAFYISQYPVKQMGDLFARLFDNMQENEWLWEAKGYDVKVTERYIEAVADFYMYYDNYERAYAEGLEKETAKFENRVARERKKIEKKVTKEVEAAYAKEHQEEIARIREEYSIENAIRAAISTGVERKLTESFEHILNGLKDSKVQLTDFEKTLAGLLENIAKEYIFAQIKNRMGNKEDYEKVLPKLTTDVDLFVAEWTEKLTESETVITNLVKGDRN
ncbi:MAG: hypothetical protein E7260_00655 [Lachnospiraceae bacterium]|nr:hypothetical protein [Lachnospiraceae bacterium]